MKFLKWFLLFSLAGNIVLGYALFREQEFTQAVHSYEDSHFVDIHELYRDSTYRKFFIEKNNAVYRDYYGRSFEDRPVQAFMIACTYYLLTEDKTVEEDIKTVCNELKGSYGVAPQVKCCK